MRAGNAGLGSKRRALAVVAAALLLLSAPEMSFAGLATDQVKGTVDQVLKILTDPALKGERKTQERRAKLRQVVLQRFGFDEMAKRAAAKGYQWADLSLTGENNEDTRPLAMHAGAQVYKRYRFYRKEIL